MTPTCVVNRRSIEWLPGVTCAAPAPNYVIAEPAAENPDFAAPKPVCDDCARSMERALITGSFQGRDGSPAPRGMFVLQRSAPRSHLLDGEGRGR